MENMQDGVPGGPGLRNTDLDNQRLKEDMRLNMSSLVRFGKGPEKTTESNIVLAKICLSINGTFNH